MKLSTRSHASKIPTDFHEPTPDAVIKTYAIRAIHALEKTWSVDGVAQKLGQSPYDWYGTPEVSREASIRQWIKICGVDDIENSNAFARVLSWAIAYTVQYMSKKEYYLPQKIRVLPAASMGSITKYLSGLSDFSQEKDEEAASVFLKFLRATYQAFTFRKQNGEHVFDQETAEVRHKDTEFINKIMDFFNGNGFIYKEWSSARFTKATNNASGIVIKNGRPIQFIAKFRPKTIDSQICKWVSQVAYDTLEALKDRNAMRLEVRSLSDIPEMLLVILESGLISNLANVSIEQKWQLFEKENEVWKNFRDSLYGVHEGITRLFASEPKEKLKANTIAERKEVKIVCTQPSFEVQIMLIGNSNNAGWKADPFYKMKEDIDEEIRVNQWYVHKKRIMTHIERWLPSLSLYNINGISSKMVFDRFLQEEHKLTAIYHDAELRDNTWPQHAEFFTNKDFITRSIRIRQTPIPWSYWSWETNTWVSLNAINPSLLSSPK